MTPDFASRNWGLVIGATDFVARDSLPFIPMTVPAVVTTWLEGAIVSGGAGETGILVHGSLDRRQPKNEKIYSVATQAEGLALNFDERWPNLFEVTGPVAIDNRGLVAKELGVDCLAHVCPTVRYVRITPHGWRRPIIFRLMQVLRAS